MTSLVYSPIDGELVSPRYDVIPRSAFLIFSQNARTSEVERRMQASVMRLLKGLNIRSEDTVGSVDSIDILRKIIKLIRGTGFSIAIYSDSTLPRTLANIYYEIALAHLFGKHVIRLTEGSNSSGSDLGRNEYISYAPNNARASLTKLRKQVLSILAGSEVDYKLACFQMSMDPPDLESAVHLLQRAILVADHIDAALTLKSIQDDMAGIVLCKGQQQHYRLLNSIGVFLSSYRESGV